MVGALPTPRHGLAGISLANKIIVTGGKSGWSMKKSLFQSIMFPHYKLSDGREPSVSQHWQCCSSPFLSYMLVPVLVMVRDLFLKMPMMVFINWLITHFWH